MRGWSLSREVLLLKLKTAHVLLIHNGGNCNGQTCNGKISRRSAANYYWDITLQLENLICGWVGSFIPFLVLILPQVTWLVSQKCNNFSVTIIILLLTVFSGNGKPHNSNKYGCFPGRKTGEGKIPQETVLPWEPGF